MSDFIFRTEEMTNEQIQEFYLDLTPWQIDKIRSVSINTIGELLGADESALMKASYIAGKRARSIKNAAYAAVYEFLLG